MKNRTPWVRRGAGALAASLLAACGMEAGEMPPAPPPAVTVTTLKPEALTVSEDFPGRVAALRVAEIRPQVSGIVQRRLFQEGAEVRAGQPLFAINAAPFQAEAAIAAAALQRAEAALARAQQQHDRLAPLARAEAVSRQAFDDATTERDLAAADVAQARATHRRRQLDLAFSTVEAPIAGRIDQALQTEGALVAATDATPLARIVQIDQVYVDVRQPAAALASLRRRLETAGKGRAEAGAGAGVPVTVLGADGAPLDLKARVLFSGMSVDAGTGDVLMRVLVDNPRRELLPGMFVRARLSSSAYDQALRVPQQAVQRGAMGTQVWVLSGTGEARRVTVQLGELIDRHYRVSAGLRAGDRVVVTGMDRLVEGVKTQVVASEAASPLAAASTAALR